jgi:GntR family transcriptional regulator
MADAERVGFRPLYLQVREELTRRLIDGRWLPGQHIPSEILLAQELGVSQGTVRKALDEMTAEHLLVRRQGRGTFVAEPEDGRVLFQFFHLHPDSGDRAFPDSRILARETGPARPDEAKALALPASGPVHRIERLRFFGAHVVLVETVVLPLGRFAGIDDMPDPPNNIYRFYSERWGITIARASERLKAVGAAPKDAAVLGVPAGTPLLSIRRIALDLAAQPVELRLSRCLTEHTHYGAELR